MLGNTVRRGHCRRKTSHHLLAAGFVESLSPKGVHRYAESPFRGAKICQRTCTARPVNRKRRECPSRRFFVFPSVSGGLRRRTPIARCLCFAAVPFGVRKGLLQRARFRAKLSDSLTLWLARVAELTHRSLSGCWFWIREMDR